MVLEGEVTISTGAQVVHLSQYDSVCLAPGEARKVENPGNRPAMLLLAIAYRP